MAEKKDLQFFPFSVINRIKKEKEARKRSKEIDRELRRQKNLKRRSNIIVTGGCNSGKSSLIEQFKLQTFSVENEKLNLDNLRKLCFEFLSNPLISGKDSSQELGDVENLNEKSLSVMLELFEELHRSDITGLVNEGNAMSEIERYCFDNYQRILNHEGCLTFQDRVVLNKSTFKYDFVENYVPCRDIRGLVRFTQFRKQISEKINSKFISSYFDNTDAIFFCCSLDGYHCKNPTTGKSQMEEDLEYFKFLANLPCLQHVAINVFLTKNDILKTQADQHPPSTYFPDFVCKDKSNLDREFCEFISVKFCEFIIMHDIWSKNWANCICIHNVCTVDVDMMKSVISDVNNVICCPECHSYCRTYHLV